MILLGGSSFHQKLCSYNVAPMQYNEKIHFWNFRLVACPKVLSKTDACEPQHWPLVIKSSENYINFRILEVFICALTAQSAICHFH